MIQTFNPLPIYSGLATPAALVTVPSTSVAVALANAVVWITIYS